jgi:hypothetical protein
VIGCGDGDGVDFFEGEDIAEVFVSGGRVAHLLRGLVDELSEDVAVHIADVGDAGLGSVRFERGEVSVGPAVQAYDREVEAVVCAHNLCVAFGC